MVCVVFSSLLLACRLQERNTMLQAMVDSPEEAEGRDAPQAERPPGTGGSMTSSTLHRILQVCCSQQQLATTQYTYHSLLALSYVSASGCCVRARGGIPVRLAVLCCAVLCCAVTYYTMQTYGKEMQSSHAVQPNSSSAADSKYLFQQAV